MQARQLLPGAASPKRSKWLLWGMIGLLILGIFFRFYHLDHKVYWVDETHTSLRMSGYKRSDLADNIFIGKIVSVEEVQRYQRPRTDRPWSRIFHTLRSSAEHSPLYFVLARLWVDVWGYSVATIRSLSAVLSLLIFPSLFWLCYELFASSAVSWKTVGCTALGLVAVSPLHILYAQEARPYSLLSVMVVLASAALLRALRSPSRRSWGLYAATVAIGLYTQLLFGTVMIAHALYVTVMEDAVKARKLSQNVRSYLKATGIGLLIFSPWLVNLLLSLGQIKRATVSLGREVPLIDRLYESLLNISRVFVEPPVGALVIGGLLSLLAAYALYFLYHHTPRQTWLLLLLLVGVSSGMLLLPDLVQGGLRSLRIRYLFPFFIGLQVAIAYVLTYQWLKARGWQRRAWQFLTVSLIIGSVATSATNAQAEISWNKEIPKTAYFMPVADLINQAEKPLVISDGEIIDMVAFSYRLKPEVHLQLMREKFVPKFKRVPRRFETAFLLSPSKKLRDQVMAANYDLIPIYKDEYAPESEQYRLWQVERKKRPANGG